MPRANVKSYFRRGFSAASAADLGTAYLLEPLVGTVINNGKAWDSRYATHTLAVKSFVFGS